MGKPMKGIAEVSVTFSFYVDEDQGFTDLEEIENYSVDAALEVMSDKFISEFAVFKFHEDDSTPTS